jgi:hypothetical protein
MPPAAVQLHTESTLRRGDPLAIGPPVGASYWVHIMRPVHTHGSTHRVDLVVRPSQPVPGQPARRAQAVVPAPKARCGRAGWNGRRARPAPTAAADGQDPHPVHHLAPNGAHPPLCVGVGLWRPDRRAPHWIPSAVKTASKAAVSGSRSRNRKRRPRSSSSMGRLRACCVTQSPIGCGVTASSWTRRVPTSSTNRTSSRCRQTVSTMKKSTASTPWPVPEGTVARRPPSAWVRIDTGAVQHGPYGAGCDLASGAQAAQPTVERREPQVGCSLASRGTSPPSSAAMAGRPRRCGWLQRRRTTSRCQRGSVAGWTNTPARLGVAATGPVQSGPLGRPGRAVAG